jgi:hypothetical protein
MARTKVSVWLSMIVAAWVISGWCHGFLVGTAIPRTNLSPSKQQYAAIMLNNLGIHDRIVDSTVATTTSLTIAAEEWRQYVSLAIVAGVLIDILLGSPLANAVLKPLRDAQAVLTKENGGSDDDRNNSSARARSKERIDSEKVAQEAINKAQNTLELKKYLEARKTDWDKMEDLKRSLDKTMQELDDDLQARQESLDKRGSKT